MGNIFDDFAVNANAAMERLSPHWPCGVGLECRRWIFLTMGPVMWSLDISLRKLKSGTSVERTGIHDTVNVTSLKWRLLRIKIREALQDCMQVVWRPISHSALYWDWYMDTQGTLTLGQSICEQWIPSQKACNAVSVPVLWRHHEYNVRYFPIRYCVVLTADLFNSLRPSDAYMRRWTNHH